MFSIDGTNGQLQTKAALDHETKVLLFGDDHRL